MRPWQTASRRERRSLMLFAGGALVLAATWLLGFTLRAPIWSETYENVQRSGIFRMFGRTEDIRVGTQTVRLQGTSGDMVNILLLILLMVAAYLVCLFAVRRGFPRAFPIVLGATAVVTLCVLPVAPLTSPDAVHFAADVRTMVLHGKNPADGANAPAKMDDPVSREVITYKDYPSGYGPASYAIGGAAVPFVGDGLRANLFGVKAVSAVFFFALTVVVGLIAKQLGREPAPYAAAVGLNPLLLWEFPADGHNDTIMVAFGLLALLLATRERWKPRLVSIGPALVSVLAKYALVVAAPMVLAWWLPRLRYVFAALMILGGIGAFIGLLTGVLDGDTGTAGPATGLTNNSPWQLFSTEPNVQLNDNLFAISYLMLCAIGAAIIIKHPLETAADCVGAVGLFLFLFLFVCSPSLRHWYQLWYFPFAILSGRRWLVAASLAFSLSAFLTILAANFHSAIDLQMGINSPLDKSVVAVWVITVAAALFVYWQDEQRERQAALARPKPGASRTPVRGRGRGRARGRA